MKKTYTLPSMEITVFTLNNAITACTPESIPDDKMVYVHCLKTNKHAIFYDACVTNGGANYNTSSDDIITYNSQQYFLWPYDPHNSVASGEQRCDSYCDECNDGKALFDEIADYLGSADYHIAPVTPQVVSVVNSSL